MRSIPLMWAANAFYVQALPLREGTDAAALVPRRKSVYTDVTYGTSTEGRLSYGLVSFACLFALAFVLGKLYGPRIWYTSPSRISSPALTEGCVAPR